MHALIIDHDAEAKLVALRKKAEENVVTFKEMYQRHLDFQAGAHNPRNDMTVMLKVRYACTYTIEEHRPSVPCRHISVSGPNALPAPQAVSLLMKFMGFQLDLLDAKVWTEEVGPDRHAVNVLEPVDLNWERLMAPVEGTMQ